MNSQVQKRHIVQHDIRTVFQGVYEVQQALTTLFEENKGAIYITNAKASQTLSEDHYCLIIDSHHIELREGEGVLQSVITWDVGTGNIYRNQHLQDTSYIMDLMGKLRRVLTDLKERKAGMFQHH